LFAGKAKVLLQSGTHESFFTWVGSGLTFKHKTRLERLARDKHSSLLRKSVNYDVKSFIGLGAGQDWSTTVLVAKEGTDTPSGFYQN
jgi:hypothetical protein